VLYGQARIQFIITNIIYISVKKLQPENKTSSTQVIYQIIYFYFTSIQFI